MELFNQGGGRVDYSTEEDIEMMANAQFQAASNQWLYFKCWVLGHRWSDWYVLDGWVTHRECQRCQSVQFPEWRR